MPVPKHQQQLSLDPPHVQGLLMANPYWFRSEHQGES